MLLQAAFRDLHGSRLHGFCLLVSLGDRASAAAAASDAVAHATPRLEHLRHPERAAAWLRRVALRQLQAGRRPVAIDRARLAALEAQGVARPAIWGLAALSLDQRAALVAADIERFAPADVELVVGRSPAAATRLIAEARQRYVASATRHLRDAVPEALLADGPVGRRVAELASGGIGRGWFP